MSTSLPADLIPRQGQNASPDDAALQGDISEAEIRFIHLLRNAIDTAIDPTTGMTWQREALATHLDLPSANYLSRMFSTTPDRKRWTPKHLANLPLEIKRQAVKMLCASLGLVCLEPPASREAALQQVTAGLVSLLYSTQPTPADITLQQVAAGFASLLYMLKPTPAKAVLPSATSRQEVA